MENYARFRDEKYKNWLKAAESLYILRNHIRDFVENETETHHKTLRKKLNSDICNKQCDFKKCQLPAKKLCETCERWKSEIVLTHIGKGKGVYWINCRPYLWPKEKWEVAKVYMPRGHTDHCSFEQFDISAILNFMGSCTHFKPFVQSKDLSKVINTRNIVMHSPEFRLDETDMKNGVENVLSLAELLNSRVPGDLYKTVLEAIEEFNAVLENCLGQDSKLDGNENILLLDREQQALKEKIESLLQRYEADQNEGNTEELQGMRNFLEQNKDLLENLKPQVERLNEIQEKVDEHEVKIVHLSGRVDDLEKATTTDSMFTIETLQFKNHLIEQTRKRKWPDPVFTEEIEPSGYRGRVEVNGHTFIGFQARKKKVIAHQEVAKIALDSLRSEFESTVEPLSSATTTSSNPFHCTVTVVLDKVVVSDGAVKQEEAIESAYSKLVPLLKNLKDLPDGNRTAVLAHLNKCGVKPPQELLLQKGDEFFCELQLKESFTFNDEDGSSTKKKTEQQAASIALQRLSTFLNSSSLAVRNENYKGFLKERLDALGMDSTKTVYTIDEEKATEDPEGPGTSIDASQSYRDESNEHNTENLQVCSTQTNTHQEVAKIPMDLERTKGPLTPASISSVNTTTSSSSMLFYGTVIVVLEKEISSDSFLTKEEAIESAYKKFTCVFGLNYPNGDSSFKTAVCAHFEKCQINPPQELSCSQDDKFVCKLQLSECFPFHDEVGFSNKKKAEQQAAKLALQQLSPFLTCSPLAAQNENYKGFLKERLEACGIDSTKTEYKTEQKAMEELEGPGTMRDTSHMSSTQTRQNELELSSVQPNDNGAVVHPPPTSHSSCAAKIPDSSPSSVPNEVLEEDYAEIHSLLTVHHLKPPSVTVERFTTDQNVSLTLNIALDKFTFKNLSEYTSKKEATRKTYCLLGFALGIFPKDTDENKATMLVKQDFSKKTLALPKEIVDGEKTSFWCSIGEITYTLTYEGQGSTEDEAKQDTLNKALLTLPSLFGFPHLPKSSSTGETEDQINSLLRKAGQKDLTFSDERNQHKVSVTLAFSDYTMTSKMQRTKKENRNLLSKRILGLLGVETEPQCPSLRNCVDDWFKQKGLQQPVFTDTEEALGCKAVFSVQLSCSHPDWEDKLEAAKMKLVQELHRRFRNLVDSGKQD
ncbi:hypothetical protein AMEX_G24133 [Astyanax mexicanus]|uniref:DRBM domain-containing protein n=1 Tax=Astyanax mexicanus TaxID=7994 RepID=A0A8T2KZB0_ASTMX|nr:hypothetical protein AMEX_G24133 [Astyanax mexicanus]